MNKCKYLFSLLIVVGFLLFPKNTYAFSSANYENKSLCGNFEVAGLHSNGVINPVSCHTTYDAAKQWMKSNGATDLVVFGKVGGVTKILDANLALVDLSVNPETLTNFYTNSELTGSAYTYMDTGSLYGGVDGVFLDSAYSNAKNVFVAKVRIGNFTGWIRQSTYEIVPLTWVKSSSSYTVTNESIRHNYVAKIQNTYSGSSGSTIGPKPDMLPTGTYYSYDGHYFYKDLATLIKDYKNGNYNNSINKNNVYYNYYMYLSNHTRTSYSSYNIDEYIRNNMGITQDAYGNATNNGSSRLYGKGTFFYYAQEKYGVNAILSLSLSRNETGNGRSNLAINKNNGFGLNAVDSSPTQSANWYASFASSILGYTSKWITYGYAHPRDWRYFGPQFGDKWIGMNVKYASDTYWSEKMAANYYSFDKAKGLQDYNYYQLGVVTRQVNAMSDATNSSKFIYSYPEAEDALVIVGEKQGQAVEGNTLWYKVVSDLNIDSNLNEITSGDYNWNSNVYVPAAYVKKINKGKNGYISPNDVTAYQNKDYEYDLYVENTELKPKVAKTNKETSYYYDSSLQVIKNQKVLANRYVMVYSAAYNANGQVVSYLVTSDYKYDQKEWIPAHAINFIESDYGKVTVSVSGNQYTWVNSIPEDTKATLISGHYTNSYVPVVEQKTVAGHLWYKVPVDLDGTKNEFGYTLASAPGVSIALSRSKVKNHDPVIIATDKSIVQGTKFSAKDGVTATDTEDGNITSKIEVVKNTVNIDQIGNYEVTYKVTDSNGSVATKTIQVIVTENKKPVITAEDKELSQKQEFAVLKDISATDKEDGNITSKIKVVENTVNTEEPGEYKVTYEVTDSYNQTVTKTIKVTVIKNESPTITAEDKTVTQGTKFDELKDVSATDKEDGDLTEKIEVIENTVNTKKLGDYKVTYKVVDSFKNETTKTIKVEVVENQKPVIKAEDKKIYLNESFNELKDVSAIDPEDGDLTEKIEVVENTVNTKELGIYKVVYKVKDSFGNVTEKEIKVEVVEKKLEQKEGTFYFDYLKKENGKLVLKGYQTITGINHTLEEKLTYKVIFKNIDTGKEIEDQMKRITDKNEMSRPVFSPDGKDYTYAWFTYNIDLSILEEGNYQLYVVVESNDYFAKTIVSNKLYREQTSSYIEDKAVIISNNYNNKLAPVELNVRNVPLAKKESSYYYNQFDTYRIFEFNMNKTLHLRGLSYSYGANLAKDKDIKRTIIFENKETYKTYRYDLGSITTGNYKAPLPESDNLDKTKAWYDNSIDISNIPKGEYVIYITTESNVIDIAEFTEKLNRSLDTVRATIDGKNYSFNINMNRGNRIELIVK